MTSKELKAIKEAVENHFTDRQLPDSSTLLKVISHALAKQATQGLAVSIYQRMVENEPLKRMHRPAKVGEGVNE